MVHAYRTLVPRHDRRLWDYCSTKSIAVRRDLYTSVAQGRESDRIERWLNDEVENPAQAVLDRLSRGTPLTRSDRKTLARYIASLDARSPVFYHQHTEMVSTHIEGVLNDTMKVVLAAFERGKRPPELPANNLPSPSIAVTVDRGEPGADNASLRVNVIVGREMWLEAIERIVDKLSVALESLDWRVVGPHDGWTWYTTDYPLLKLNYYDSGQYDLRGGFGSIGTEIILPLSPTDVLFAQVGKPAKLSKCSIDQTLLIKRFIAEHAHRWIVSASPVKHAAWFRRRVVSLEKYKSEEEGWKQFHGEQSQAVFELHRKDGESAERAS